MVYPINYEAGESLALISFIQKTAQHAVTHLGPKSKTVCPAHSGIYVPCSISPSLDGKSVLVTGNASKLEVPRTLVTPVKGVCSIFVVNFSAKPVLLTNGAHFCTAEEVHVLPDLDQDTCVL